MRSFAIVILFVLLFYSAASQYKVADSFKVEQGLPSNYIYNCIEDKYGFLWISTDLGLVRFDGKRMQLFTMKNGLPENEIENMVQEQNGKLWVQSYNQQIAYFNDKEQKFVTLSNKHAFGLLKPITKISANTLGGMLVHTSAGTISTKGNNLTSYPITPLFDSSIVFQENQDGTQYRYKLEIGSNQKNILFLYHTNSKQILEQKLIHTSANIIDFNLYDSTLYLFQSGSNKITIISNFTNRPFYFKIKENKISNPYNGHNFTNKYINILHRYTKRDLEVIDINVYDYKFFQKLFTINQDVIAWYLYNDRKENVWVSTHTGLYLFTQPKSIRPYLDHKYNNTTFYSITKKEDGCLLFGNSNSEVIEKKNNKESIIKVQTQNSKEWQRAVMISQHKVFTFSDGGVFINYNKPLLFEGQTYLTNCVTALNDSILILGNNIGLYKLNTISENISLLNHSIQPITSVANSDDHYIYVGSDKGLHIYDMIKNEFEVFPGKLQALKGRILSICQSQDTMFWVATSNNLIGIKNNKIVVELSDSNGLASNNFTTLAIGKQGQIWAGTFAGISNIQYHFENGKIESKVQNISLIDGLASTAIHQLFYDHDTLFAATDKGISCIPNSIPIPEIPIVITRLRINQKDTMLLSYFDLNANQNNISLDFSGVELNGYFGHAQYSQDNGITWIDLEENNFTIQLRSGQHYIWLRAIDINKNVSKKITKLQFDIDTPFYRSWWFWLCIGLFILGIAIYTNTMITKRKQQKQIDILLNQQALDELEIQALKSQMNPHFVFNCLASIQSFLYEENFEQADFYLRKFSHLLRSTLNYSSQPSISLQAELEYIETYLIMEKLRFGNKFEHEIEVDHEMPTKKIQIPSMLLQPYVENSIKHGIYHLKSRTGKIDIKVSIVEIFLHIHISDNGIGREKAMKIKQSQQSEYESKGTQLTQRRIELYHIDLQIEDKKNESGEAEGTSIHLKIPLTFQSS